MVVMRVAMKNGDVQTVYGADFHELFKRLEPHAAEVVSIRGKAILHKDMRQGRMAETFSTEAETAEP